ncbi:MAG: hypothetical protein HYR94_26250 [Chloroflexi bacterium]|nr:hypothetical protein [Chloroflexota bacterium]
MGVDVWVRESPGLVPANYKTVFETACELRPAGFKWYKGTGLAPQAHPLAGYIPFKECAACGSSQVVVIAAQWNVHVMNGDEYWDYELACQICHKFTQRSFADND